MQDDRLCEFVYIDGFLEDAEGLLDEDTLRALENELLEDPRRGRTIRGTSGFRKIRAAAEGRGKRGGAGVIYYYVDRRRTVYFIMAYPKNVKDNVTPAEEKVLRKIAQALEEEG